MRYAVSAVLCFAVLFSMPVQTEAIGKVTTDPSVSGARAAGSEPDKDTRLAQKVTYEARHKAVSAVLSDLSQATGVKFRAGWNENDWQVRDRKMNIFVKDLPLAQLMDSIARVMKFKWSATEKDGLKIYRLFLDRRTLLDTETRALREAEKYEKQLAERRERLLGSLGDLDHLSPKDMEKLKAERPYLYTLASSGMAGPLSSFFSQVPSAIEALASGQEMTIDSRDISSSAQQSILQYLRAGLSLSAKLAHQESPTLPEDEEFTILLNNQMEETDSHRAGSVTLGNLYIEFRHMGINMELYDPDTEFANLMGKANIESQEHGTALDAVLNSMQEGLRAAVASQVSAAGPGEPVTKHPKDPALDAMVKLKLNEYTLEKAESALADISGLSIVSDSFGLSDGLVRLDGKEIALKEALDKIADGFYYNWDKHSSVLEFRNRDWFHKRNVQIPQDRIDAWATTLKTTGTLDIGDLAQIAVLTQEQFNVNIMADEDLARSGVSGAICPNRDILRAYAGLHDAQRTALFTQAGLDTKTLTSEQRKLISKLTARAENTSLTLTGTRSQRGKQFEYTFSLSAPGDLVPAKWTLLTPKYQEAPKEQPKIQKEEQQPVSSQKPAHE